MKDSKKKLQQIYELMKANQGRISKTCEQAGISRVTYYKWRKIHPEWAIKVDEIEKEFIEAIKVKAIQISLEGNTSMIQFMLSKRMPEEFGAPEKIAFTDPTGEFPYSFTDFVKAVNEIKR